MEEGLGAVEMTTSVLTLTTGEGGDVYEVVRENVLLSCDERLP